MGVHGLWDLLAPVGRRVSVETLAGKKLAIDASIWLVQFMKAMRDEKGEMVRNAHLLGLFRRICKLLYLRTKPVFVFDGGTPALKRRTVIARRRQRENAQAKIRKTAEKLLLNQLKAMGLKELSKDLEKQKEEQNAVNQKRKQKKANLEENNNLMSSESENLHEMLAASLATVEGGNSNNIASTSAAAAAEDTDSDEDEEMILPAMDEIIDPAVLAALPPSMQLDILTRERLLAEKGNSNQDRQSEKYKSNAKGKEILSDETEMEGFSLGRDRVAIESHNQEKMDEMLAASMQAEEEGGDEDEEMILPHGKVDPAVLASLPPSMQLDLLVQMREKLIAENRQRYQKVKKVPEKFSELQIQAYLKTVAFRREIDQVQKAAAGNGVGGVQASRIASEANREFIFSSSFSGHKELLTTAGVKRNIGDKQQKQPVEQPSADVVDGVASIPSSNTVTGLVQDEPSSFDDDVETYLDERGRIRVSRVRAMGLRMTCDLQRNLDLMKEVEKEKTLSIKSSGACSEFNRNKIDMSRCFPPDNLNGKGSHCSNDDSVSFNNENGQSLLNSKTSVQISFEVGDENNYFSSDDEVFASLVAGKPVKMSSDVNYESRRCSPGSASESDWEEGFVEGKGNSFPNNIELRTEPSPKGSSVSEDTEVEWGGGDSDFPDNFSYPAESRSPVSRGSLEEEAALQEAIRRSLTDTGAEKFILSQSNPEKVKTLGNNDYEGVGLLDQEDNIRGPNKLEDATQQQEKPFSEILGSEMLGDAGEVDMSEACPSLGSHVKSYKAYHPDNVEVLIYDSCESYQCSIPGQLSKDVNKGKSVSRDIPLIESDGPSGVMGKHSILEPAHDIEDHGLPTSDNKNLGNAYIAVAASRCVPLDKKAEPSTFVHGEKISSEGGQPCHSNSLMESYPNKSLNGSNVAQDLDGGRNSEDHHSERECHAKNSAVMDNENHQCGFTEASLEKEMLMLGQEYRTLGDEQRKLERNAESVSSEMFAECQELLQMFGLPFIIAPMEAEAQCAYMELANFVDGVVTDDSDVFLFGAKSVYKNIFDDRKYVETYFMKEIEKEIGLTREKLIRIALLLGSDYTEGVSGIGIVNAIEVVTAFPEEDGLQKFKEWIESPDPAILGKFDFQTGLAVRKEGSKVGEDNANCTNNNTEGINPSDQNFSHDHDEKKSADHSQELKRVFMLKHRNVSKNWHIPPPFPSEAVISAYSSPQVDKSTEPFTWGKPDLHSLHRLCWEKFGWDTRKSDGLLMPVLKEFDKHETQLRLEAFYSFNERFAKIRSKRIKNAVKGIIGNQSPDKLDDPAERVSKSRRTSRNMPGKSGDKEHQKHPKRTAKSAFENDNNSLDKSNPTRSRKRRTTEHVLSEVENTEGTIRKYNNRGMPMNEKRRGRRRGGGIRRGRGKGSIDIEQSNSSSCDISSGHTEHEVYLDESKGPNELRKSTRPRKPVSYTVSETDIDEEDQGNKKRFDGEPSPQGLSCKQEACRDAGTDVNASEQFDVGDSSIQGFSRDCRFPVDGEAGSPGMGQSICPLEVKVSDDCLEMGGGFCLDEGEADVDQDTARGPPTTGDSSYFSGVLGDVDHSTKLWKEVRGEGKASALDTKSNAERVIATDGGEHSRSSVCVPEGTKDNNTEVSTVGGLSAMPFLKRKRRR